MAASLSSALLAALLILGLAASHVAAADADPLQDFCVADLNSSITINGLVCKPAAQVDAYDFKSSVLMMPMPINPALGSAVTLASALNFPGLNTQGLSVARIDFDPQGVNPPHVHPRATEVVFLAEGTLEVGFITATPDNTLFQQTLSKGDLFVFPRGLVHFQLNPDKKKPAVAIAALNSQNPGTSQVAAAVFAAQGPLPEEVLEKAFGINEKEVSSLQASVAQTIAA